MRRASWLWLGVFLLLSGLAQAQPPSVPLVAFVVERDLQTASLADEGPDGVSRLAEMFQQQGAQTRFIRLSEPLPDDVAVIVLVRPLRSLPAESLARLWRHLERGTHLLLALDPVGYPDRRIDGSGSGLGRLLTGDYGVNFLDTFLAEPWFTSASVTPFADRVQGSLIAAQADYLPHPITTPLAQYQVPVMTWGTRTILSEPWGIASSAHSLLITNTAFGEADLNVFIGRGEVLPPLQFNIDADQQGELTLAAVGENARTGSRIAVLGDSEMLQNGFGLEQTVTSSGGERPRFPGNVIFAQRLVAWLLETPAADYPALPEGFSWLAVDGRVDDWDVDSPAFALPDFPVAGGRTFRNDEYLYFTLEPLPDDTWQNTFDRLEITLTPQLSASPPIDLILDSSGVRIADTEQNLPDAAVVVDLVLEARLPLRVIGNNDVVEITRICLTLAGDENCHDGDIIVRRITERDPVPVRISGLPLATITNPGAANTNLRSGPDIDSPAVAGLPNGTVMAVLGRNPAADWIYVEAARYSGWLFAPLATLTIEPELLPVLPLS